VASADITCGCVVARRGHVQGRAADWSSWRYQIRAEETVSARRRLFQQREEPGLVFGVGVERQRSVVGSSQVVGVRNPV